MPLEHVERVLPKTTLRQENGESAPGIPGWDRVLTVAHRPNDLRGRSSDSRKPGGRIGCGWDRPKPAGMGTILDKRKSV